MNTPPRFVARHPFVIAVQIASARPGLSLNLHEPPYWDLQAVDPTLPPIKVPESFVRGRIEAMAGSFVVQVGARLHLISAEDFDRDFRPLTELDDVEAPDLRVSVELWRTIAALLLMLSDLGTATTFLPWHLEQLGDQYADIERDGDENLRVRLIDPHAALLTAKD